GDARDVNRIMQACVAECGAELVTDCKVLGFNIVEGRIVSVSTSQGELRADRFILTTGGLSYPKTGGTGDGYGWARDSGHRVIKPEPALVPVTLKEPWTGEVNRFNLKNVRITLHLDGKKIDERFGEAFFTRKGIGGPIILDMSKAIRDALKVGKTTLLLDLKPAVEHKKFDRRLQREFEENQNREFRNSLGDLLPHDLIALFIRLSGIDPEKRCHSITKGERQKLLKLFKELELNVDGYEGFDKAIVTSGGVCLDDIDMRTMRSRKVENLYFAGEIIDLDGRTGGFNLQVCWSTGFLAGASASS
ncbi:MAG: aminoacetone oxidase family FAD-binding enzyme, partial [Myxococcales bacterium]|nr:aminoacetone oxidase family FAD-binding enzyme [Myxococcales bacterium]